MAKSKSRDVKRYWIVFMKETDGEMECQHLTREEILDWQYHHGDEFAVFDGHMLKGFAALGVHWRKEE